MRTLYLLSTYKLYHAESDTLITSSEYIYKHCDFAKIIDTIENSTITSQELDNRLSQAINKSYALKNQDASDFLTNSKCSTIYDLIIKRQTILPERAINYYLVKYIDGQDSSIKHCANVITVDTSCFNEELYSIMRSTIHNSTLLINKINLEDYPMLKSTLKQRDLNFIAYLSNLLTIHFEVLRFYNEDMKKMNGYDYKANHLVYNEFVSKLNSNILKLPFL